jgi:hypothetical protein
MYLDYLLSSQDVTGGIVPKIAEKYISVVAIDGFPAESYILGGPSDHAIIFDHVISLGNLSDGK